MAIPIFTAITNFFLSSALTAINSNFEKIRQQFQTVVYRDGSLPMLGNLDMNSKQLLNLGESTSLNAAATVGQVLEIPRGPTGAPGGNVMAIGLFTAASGMVIPAGANLVQTSGYSVNGVGVAKYVRDAAVNAAFVLAYPRASFLDSTGSGFRIAEQVLHPFMFGGKPSTGIEYTNVIGDREIMFDCSTAIEAMTTYAKTRPERPGLDFRSRGMGISRTVVLTYDTFGPFNSKRIDVYPGRLVAMSQMTNMIEITGNNCQEFGQWVLIGGGWRVGGALEDAAYYTARLAKNGVMFKGVGGGIFGGAHVQGVRRYAVQFFKSFSADNNSIGASFGPIRAILCGSSPASADFEITGTYTSPNGRVGPNNSNDQTQDLLLTSTGAGFDPADIEVDDLIEIVGSSGKQQTVRVTATPGTSNGTQRLVTVFPWVKDLTGAFRSYHGGGLSTTNFNMANTTFQSVITLYCGTGWQMGCQYAPTLRSLLAEGAGCGLQFGDGVGGQEGMNLEHYHFENVRRAIVDTNATAVKNCYVGAASNLAFDEQYQFFGLCEKLAPGLISGSVYYQFPRSTGLTIALDGVTYHGKGGGGESTLQGQNNAITIGNLSQFQYGSIREMPSTATQAIVTIDKSKVTFNGDSPSIDIPFFFFGAHATGKLANNLRFILSTENPSGVTLNGGTAEVVINPALYVDAPISGRIVLTPDDNGNGDVNARVFISTPLKPVP